MMDVFSHVYWSSQSTQVVIIVFAIDVHHVDLTKLESVRCEVTGPSKLIARVVYDEMVVAELRRDELGRKADPGLRLRNVGKVGTLQHGLDGEGQTQKPATRGLGHVLRLRASPLLRGFILDAI
jgi:hypothetical protein